MAFGFLGFRKKPVIQDVEVKVPTPVANPVTMTFDQALAAQAAAEGGGTKVDEDVKPADVDTSFVQIVEETVAAEETIEPVTYEVTESSIPEESVNAQSFVAIALPPETVIANDPIAAEPDGPSSTPEILGQMDTVKATREDVIAAYKIFLGRLPESVEVLEPRVGVVPAALLVDFLASKEFLDQAPKAQLVLAVAKKILDARKQAAAAEVTTPAAEAVAPSAQGQPAA